MRLAGKIALITGGGAGIGRACVELFAREGASVVIAEFDHATGEAACQAVRGQGGRAIFVPTNVSEPEQIERAVQRAVEEFGGLDVLYNNVGGSTLQDGPVTSAPFAECRRKMDIDLFGTWLGCRYAVPEMIKRGGGAIVNATSICGLRGIAGRDAYTAAKGAIAALTRSMAVEFAPDNIRVNAVAPGSTLTERVMSRMDGSRPRSAIADRHLLGLVEPIDVAYAVLHLSCDESRRTTGQILAIDSGYTAG
jgi:NAD(P)-dependent dehydrogenase (short-subunit alcohol dehydrogenase family)